LRKTYHTVGLEFRGHSNPYVEWIEDLSHRATVNYGSQAFIAVIALAFYALYWG